MAFLRRRKKTDDTADAASTQERTAPESASTDEVQNRQSDRSHGPFDSSEVDPPDPAEKRLDLGSLSLPLPQGGQVQVEMAKTGGVQGVHLATPYGRLTVSAYAAPRSSGMWRDVAGELVESLRRDGAQVSQEDGPWGIEVLAETKSADIRFIGVDGPRWMIRLVAAGPTGAGEHEGDLARAARQVLQGTIVTRGDAPMPVRTPLQITLPKALQQQLAAMQQQQAMQAAKAAAQQRTGAPQSDAPQTGAPQSDAPQSDAPQSGDGQPGSQPSPSEGTERS